jgi:hypothetical protein
MREERKSLNCKDREGYAENAKKTEGKIVWYFHQVL